ncbi:hypothetical protein FZC66_17630 [Priestia megaterium]|nr:hypothetical protein FZC66_17630 [Priestia megaterium]
MKITIINQHTNNFGDDAAGVGMAHQIRELFPEANIEFLYHSFKPCGTIPFHDQNTTHRNDLLILKKDLPDAIRYIASKFIPFISYGNGNVAKTVKQIKDADRIVVSPCGANIGIYKDWIFLLRVLMAVLEGKTPYFHLNTIGKSGNFLFDLMAKYALKKSKVYVRESKSIRELKSIGIKAEQGVDTAFSLPKRVENKFKSKDYLALIPTQFDNWHVSYRENGIDSSVKNTLLPNIATFCLENNLDIKIIPHLTGELKEDEFLEEYKSTLVSLGMSKDSVHIENEVKSFYDYEDVIKASNLVVSMRYHGVIFAIKNSIPFLSLAYENKMREACMYSETLDLNVNLKELSKTDVLSKLNYVYENEKKIKDNLKHKGVILDRLARLPLQAMYLDYISNNTKGDTK